MGERGRGGVGGGVRRKRRGGVREEENVYRMNNGYEYKTVSVSFLTIPIIIPTTASTLTRGLDISVVVVQEENRREHLIRTRHLIRGGVVGLHWLLSIRYLPVLAGRAGRVAAAPPPPLLLAAGTPPAPPPPVVTVFSPPVPPPLPPLSRDRLTSPSVGRRPPAPVLPPLPTRRPTVLPRPVVPVTVPRFEPP